ncbi:MAG: carboxylating nicotinate-nucleotide diphosphorylase [Chthonomonadales bacterium]
MDVPFSAIENIVRCALQEDVGTGDITSYCTIPHDLNSVGSIVMHEDGVAAGIAVAAEVFRQVDARVRFVPAVRDGAHVKAESVLARVEGPARSILCAERTALNFLQRLGGIATLTRQYVDAVAGTSARIVDTRKTTPGLRVLEKWAVTLGGGYNHRMGLYDAVLIKDNHIVAAGGVAEAVRRARMFAPHTMTITVECETLEQIEAALTAGADTILLDNMSNQMVAQAVQRIGGRARVEASGGITVEQARNLARSGVQIISVGAITHSVRALDISLDLEGGSS